MKRRRHEAENAYTVRNFDKNGRYIPDISKVTVKHDEMPDVWRAVAVLAQKISMEEKEAV